ncbi:MAG: hypothetical protein H6829_03715 [Planctomycetes bacterium]|nr:hypothetical protein [Planctomycetota bacterium]
MHALLLSAVAHSLLSFGAPHPLGTQDSTPPDQGTPMPVPIDLPQGLPAPGKGPLLASDGQPALPGRIPEGTSPEAIARWNQVLRSSRVGNTAAAVEPIQAFDLAFDAEVRSDVDAASNHEDVRFQFLDAAGGCLLAQFERSGRLSLRGPKGDYLYDGKTWSRLESREDKESRRELDRWVTIARNFVALTRPAAIRLVDLQSLTPTPPAEGSLRLEFGAGRYVFLPRIELMEEAKALRWLEVTSPDFRLFDTGRDDAPGTVSVYRALLGLDAEGRIAMAQFHEDHGGAVDLRGALFARIRSWVSLPSGYTLPKQLETYRPLPDRPGFETLPGLDLWLKARRAQINPKEPGLLPKHFQPPA